MQSSDQSAGAAPPRRRYLPIAQDLLREIQLDGGRSEKRLPSDRELAEKYNASRATVREALFALDMIGAIEVRQGDGTYISGRAGRLQTLDQFQYGSKPEHVIDTRIIIEPSISGELARTSASLEQAVETHLAAARIVDSDDKVPEFTRLALQFHLDLAAMIENRLLAELAYEVISIDKQPLWALINELSLQDVDHRHTLQNEHQQVLDAIGRGDFNVAADAMRCHLDKNKSRILPHS
jgi:GntR family transcriptional regulator, transcriptional repressor for pyruvate dehydrogenase complex